MSVLHSPPEAVDVDDAGVSRRAAGEGGSRRDAQVVITLDGVGL